MAKSAAPPLAEVVLDALAKFDATLPLVAKRGSSQPGLLPSAAASKHAQSQGWIIPVPDPTAPPPKKGKPKLTHARLTEDGRAAVLARRAAVFERSSPRAALEALPAVLHDLARPPAPAFDAAAVTEQIAGLQQVVADLGETLRRSLAAQQAAADAQRAMFDTFTAKVQTAVDEVRNAAAVPPPSPPPPTAPVAAAPDLSPEIIAAVAAWRREKPFGYPLPELFDALSLRHPGLTIGRYHDALRGLHAAGTVVLTRWAKSLPELPRPELALFISDTVMHYVNPADRAA